MRALYSKECQAQPACCSDPRRVPPPPHELLGGRARARRAAAPPRNRRQLRIEKREGDRSSTRRAQTHVPPLVHSSRVALQSAFPSLIGHEHRSSASAVSQPASSVYELEDMPYQTKNLRERCWQCHCYHGQGICACHREHTQLNVQMELSQHVQVARNHLFVPLPL